MSTNSRIGYEMSNGSVRSIYAHWDGYPAGVGYTVVENYSDYDKIKELVELGDVSIVDDRVGVKCDFDDRDSIPEGQCVFYGRDRGETGVDARTSESIDEFIDIVGDAGEEYGYVYTTDGLWVMYDRYGKKTVWDAEYDIRDARVKMEEYYASRAA